MKKYLLALGIATTVALPVHAEFTLYESDKETVKLAGWADIRMVHSQDETELVDGWTRVKLSFARDMGNELEATVVIETGVNLVGRTSIAFPGGDTFQTRRDDLLSLRLGFVGVSHARYGSLTLGKQWGAYYDVAGATDMGRTWGGAASGAYNFNGDGGLSGTGRAEKAVMYRNSFGDFSLALQAQFQSVSDSIDELVAPGNPGETITEIAYDSTFAVSGKYAFAGGHSLYAGFSEGTFTAALADGGGFEVDDSVVALAYSYGEYADGWYAAAFYNDAEFHELDNLNRAIPDSTGIEVYVSYRGDSRWMPYVLYNSLEADSSYGDRYTGDEFHRAFFSAGAIWFWNDSTNLYFDVRIDDSDMSVDQQAIEDDGFAIGIRYLF